VNVYEIAKATKKAFLALFFLFQGFGVVLAETPILVHTGNRVPANVTPEKLHGFIKTRNPHFDPLRGNFSNIAGEYAYWGGQCGIRWDYAFFQMLHETNFLMFTGGVRPEHFNLAGIGAIVPGEHGEVFNSLQEGVLAHIQHLALYALVDIREEDLVAHRSRRVKGWLQERIERVLKRPAHFEDLGLDGAGDRVYWAADSSYWGYIAAIASKFEQYAREPFREADFSGTWDTEDCFGNMTLFQSKGRVSGNWAKFQGTSGWQRGHITGRITGKTLSGEWVSSTPGHSASGTFSCVMTGRGSMTVSKGSGPSCTGTKR
jgi:hypothetical protein